MTADATKTVHPVALVAAVAENGVIGREGDMPWRLPSDLRRFRAITMGKPVVMGRRTFESIGRPLPGRTNIVVTRNEAFRPDGVIVARSLSEALRLADEAAASAGAAEIAVIGGGMLYSEAMACASRLHITHVDAAPNGDTRFPPIDPADWKAAAEEIPPRAEGDSASIRFVDYQRR